MSTKKNILQNGLSSIGQKGVRVLEQLFLVPFFIASWGAAYYGEWLTLTIIPSVLAFSDLGLGSAAANSFVLNYANGRKKEAATIAQTGFIVISIVISIAFLLGIVGIFLTLHFHWLKHSIINEQDAVVALVFMIMSRLIGFYMQLYGAHFRAARKAALGINLSSCNSLLNIIGGLCVLALGYGIVLYAFVLFCIALFSNVFYAIIAHNTLNLHKEVKGIFSLDKAKEILSIGLGYLMSPMWQSILFQGTTFVVRIVLGPTAVAVFNTVRTLSRSVNQLYSIVNGSIFPELQFEIGAGNMQKAKRMLSKAMRFTALLAVAGVAFLAIFGLPIYNLWTHHALNPSYMMWFILVTSSGFNAIWWTAGVVFRATNKPYQLSISGVIVAALSVGITYIGCTLFGLIGAALGCLFFEVIMAIYILPTSNKLMDSYVVENKRL